MAAVFQTIEIDWRGKTHRVTPTMRLLNTIEQDISLSRLVHRLEAGDMPLSHIATVIAAFLQSAGAEVSADEVYAELLGEEAAALGAVATAIIGAIFPATGGKKEAPQPAR